MVNAIRGATTVDENTEQEILEATSELLRAMLEQNGIETEDIISVIFSVTTDLNAAFPAVAARRMGWTETALMCTYEIDVPGSLRKCIRVMMHIRTEKKSRELKFVYLKAARQLRPDLFEENQQTGG
jgi:chorismate mutase